MPDGTHDSLVATVGRRPTAKSADTRARIVAGALKALERNGIGDTTTRRIADEAGVRLATLHYHFDSKEAVLLAVLEVLIAELTATLHDTLDARSDPPTRIAHLVRTAWAYAEATRERQVVQYELTLYALRTKGGAWLAERQYRAYVAAYRAQLWNGPGRGLDEREADVLARFILAGIDGLILQRLSGALRERAEGQVEALIAGAQALIDPTAREELVI